MEVRVLILHRLTLVAVVVLVRLVLAVYRAARLVILTTQEVRVVLVRHHQ